MQFIKKMLLLTVAAGALNAGDAAAACSYINGVTGPSIATVNFSNVIVQRDAPVGSTLASVLLPRFNFPEYFAECRAPIDQVSQWDTAQPLIDFNGQQLIPSGVPGIGIRLRVRNTLAPSYPIILYSSNGCVANSTWSRWCEYRWSQYSWSVELVKIADTTGSGTIGTPGQEIFVAGFAADPLVMQRVIMGGGGSVSTVLCSVTTPAVTVQMGNTLQSSFNGSGTGSTSPEIPFGIGLDCNAGAKVNLTLDGVQDASGADGVLALNAASVQASGLGVQVMHNNAPVTLGKELPIGTSLADGPFTIPLSARYYQTESVIIGGQANATATFTVTYR